MFFNYFCNNLVFPTHNGSLILSSLLDAEEVGEFILKITGTEENLTWES